MNALIGFTYCTALHRILNHVSWKTPHASNLLTCIGFQTPFMAYSIWTCFQKITFSMISNNLEYMYGYFFYDLCYLLQTDPFSIYVPHHIIATTSIYLLQMEKLSPSLALYSNLIVIMLEISTPLLNSLSFLQHPRYRSILLRLTYYLYFMTRIVLFPYFQLQLLPHIRSRLLSIFFVIIYSANLAFFYQLKQKI
jgi:hypothetical protein